ncbi:peptide-binding protein, partial [Burkholderia multivorans]
MTERVKRNIARWVAGALLMPLALAQPPHGSHGFGGGDMHAY